MKKYFGTDGIRGIPNKNLTKEIVSNVACSVENILQPTSVAVILDTRESSLEILDWICEGFSENPSHIQSKISNEELRVSKITATEVGFKISSTEQVILETISLVKFLFGIPRIPSVPKYFFNLFFIS